MRTEMNLLLCLFWHKQQHWRKEECMWENEDRKQVLGRKAEKKKGSKEARKKGRKDHVGGVNNIALISINNQFGCIAWLRW